MDRINRSSVSQCEIGNIDANTSHTIIQYSKVARLYAQNQVTITGCEFEGNNDGGIGIDLDGSFRQSPDSELKDSFVQAGFAG